MMKKIFLGVVAILLTMSVNGQITSGAKFGITFSKLSGFEANGAGLIDNVSSTVEDGRTGYFAGFFVGIPINEKLSFQPEFQYVQQGSNAEALRVDYLQLPLAINLDVSEKFYLNAGPQLGLRIWTPGDSNLIDTFDYSVFGSVGYNITESIFIEGRYSLGLNDIAKGGRIPLDVNDDLTSPSFKNTYFYFGVGYKL